MIVVTVARKPLASGSVAANALEHGTGAINIDSCRIATVGEENPSIATREAAVRRGRAPIPGKTAAEANEEGRIARRGSHEAYLAEHRGERFGRWPANLILGHLDGCRLLGTTRVRPKEGHRPNPVAVQADGNIRFTEKPPGYRKTSYTDEDGTEEAPVWECEPGCPVSTLDGQSGDRAVSGTARGARRATSANGQGATFDESLQTKGVGTVHDDHGGASRFFKQVGGRRA